MFSFTPTAQDADGDALKFSVQGMPTWTQFNTATGKLNGVPGPGDIGTFKNIVIRVSDGQADTQLKPFDVTVVPVGRAVTQLPTISGTPSAGLALDALQAAWRGQGFSWLTTRGGLAAAYFAILAALIDARALWVAALCVVWAFAGLIVEARARTPAAISKVLAPL